MGKGIKVWLTQEERKELEKYSTTGTHNAHLINRAKIMLALDTSEGRKPDTQEEIAKHIGVSRQALIDARSAFLETESIDNFLQRKKRETTPREIKVTGEVEAHIIALACSKAPEGYAKWTLRLLAEKAVELEYVDSLSHMSVNRVLKKHNLSLT